MNIHALASSSGLKESDIIAIEKILLKKGNFSKESVEEQIVWFFGKLGMHQYYFMTTPIEDMARHIETLLAAEIIAGNSPSPEVNLDIRSEIREQTFYLVEDSFEKKAEIEKRIEKLFKTYRLQSYRTSGKVQGKTFLRIYFVAVPTFPKNETRDDFFGKINEAFLQTSSKEAIVRYERVFQNSRNSLAPYVEISAKTQTNETRIMVSLPPFMGEDFLSKFSEVMTSYNLFTTRKYIEPLRSGRRLYSFYLHRIKDARLLETLKEDISLIALIGKTPIDDMFIEGRFKAQEYLYACCLSQFTHHFIAAPHNEKIAQLEKALSQQPEMHGIARFLKLRLAKDTYTQGRIYEVIRDYPEIIRSLYEDFRRRFDPDAGNRKSTAALDQVMSLQESQVSRELHKNIIHMFLMFNRLILKTNFYKKQKTAISFRLSPDTLNHSDYSDVPFGLFFIVAKEMQAFHVRFQDIARGGIRIVRSRSARDYETNSEFIFDENYRLAHTQQKKNKDIPEGGSKGAILLDANYQNFDQSAFKKYIDALLDLILGGPEIRDFYGSEEILFLGPDEGTAPFMDWASQYARQRGYRFWRAFTTGKSLEFGGIPHDLYGMTTSGVHEYELQILKKLGMREEDASKFQTGGPDGDLGSNEIKVSKGRYMAIVDGSGVLYDPKGINRDELIRLADDRQMVREFSRRKISKEGFLVLVEDRSVKLPDGTLVPNGTEFRNNFHLTPYAKADIFVPCGGRPQSINILNWKHLLDLNGEPAFRIIVEGANLFITQDARLELEKKGCIIIKDASANKGGVTSSSLEVLASLCLEDAEYETLFCVKAGREPAFRAKYVREVLDRIRLNARREFEVLWRENNDTRVPFSIISDQLSDKINQLTSSIFHSDLFQRTGLASNVIGCHVPRTLIRKKGIESIMSTVPEAYLRSIFASWLASDFVYTKGLHTTEIDFYAYIDMIEKKPH